MELEKQRYTGSLLRKQLADELAVAEETDEKETPGFDKTDVWKRSVVPSHPPATLIPNFRIPCGTSTSTQPCSQYEPAASEQPSTSDQPSSSISKLNANASSYIPPNVFNQPNPSIARQFTSSARPSLIPTTTTSALPVHNRVTQQTFPTQRPVHAPQPTVYSPDAWIFAVNRHDAPPTFRSSSRPPKAEPPKDAKKFRESLFSASNVIECDRENVDAVFVDFVNTSCFEVDNEQDYGESDDSGENEDNSGENEDNSGENEDEELSEMESSFEEDGEFSEEEESLENRVAAIAIKHRLSGAAVRSITNLLISLGHKIYKDRRTILKTPRTKLGSTSFKHFGLIKGLDRKLKSGLLIGSAGAELQISIDGLPLCKSRPTVFWPILCRVKNANDSRPFPVSIHCGNGGKPPDLNLYLEPLIEELKQIEINGIEINGETVLLQS
ncbi:Uncharacterized protein APZ42_031402 [Daphnia magna]|uniref:Uncharacterized protein n=1 Tax=Daphnia magna TaxID=35525 RepID=A0A164MVP5_9CRUS|nr:Uncharacterized protein APZ42_031402 [Daphnia magna]